jgi:hypothetical protein
MRVLLPLLALVHAGVATSCARAVVYACAQPAAGSDAARVEVRARTDGNYDLEIVHVDGPGHGRGFCSAPSYPIGEEATVIETREGDYALLAKAEDTTIPYAFPVRGEVSVEPGRCYLPAMACDAGARPDAATCRLVLKPTSCTLRLLPRRVVLRGMSYC